MVGRIYTVTFDVTAVTAQVDLFSFAPADDKPLRLHSVYLFQTTELGDAAEEILEIEVTRGGSAWTVGSGGSAPTPIPATSSAETAAGFTARVLDTTIATFTSGVTTHRDAWNVRVGWQYRPTPEERIGWSQANGGLSIRIGAAPADSISMLGTAYVEELG